MLSAIFVVEEVCLELLQIIQRDDLDGYQHFIASQSDLNEVMITSFPVVLAHHGRKILEYLLAKYFIINEINLKMGSPDSYIFTAIQFENLYAVQLMLSKEGSMVSLVENLKFITSLKTEDLVDFFWENQCWSFLSALFMSDFFWKKHKMEILLRAAASDDIECLGAFLDNERVKQYCGHFYAISLVRAMIRVSMKTSSNVDFFNKMFSYSSFSKQSSKKSNEFLKQAAFLENVAAIESLLGIVNVLKKELNGKREIFFKCIAKEKRNSIWAFLENDSVMIAEVSDFRCLIAAIKKRDKETVDVFLESKYLNDHLALHENKVFLVALEVGDLDVISKLLKSSNLVNSLIWENINIISNVYKYGSEALIKEFLKVPKINAIKDQFVIDLISSNILDVVNDLLNDRVVVGLIEASLKLIDLLFEKTNDETRWALAKKLSVYGLPLEMALSRDGNLLKDFKSFMKDPDRYVARFKWSPAQYLAFQLLKSKWILDKKIDLDRVVKGNFRVQGNIENKAIIGRVKDYFDTVILPVFKEKFDAYGQTDEERLQAIEKQIRKSIFLKIKENSHDENDDENFEKFFPKLDEHIDTLCAGNNQTYMNFVRRYCSSNTEDAQIAWRLYDRWAPVSGWPNLLTVPLENKVPSTHDDRIYTVSELGGPIKIPEATTVCRKVWAYTYLLMQDTEDDDLRAHWTALYICQLAEVRRANSVGVRYRDVPSCYPDTVSRIGPLIEMHPLGVGLKNSLELVKELVSPVIIQHFRETLEGFESFEEKQNFISSIIVLNEKTAIEFLKGPYSWPPIDGSEGQCSFDSSLIAMRERLVQKVWDDGSLLEHVNATLRSKKLKVIKEQELWGFLYNIGGSSIGSSLMNIYKAHIGVPDIPMVHKALNPYVLRPDIQARFSEKRLFLYRRLKRIWSQTYHLLEENLPDAPTEVLEEEATEISGLYAEPETEVPLDQVQALLFSYGVGKEPVYHFTKALARPDTPVPVLDS